MTERFETMKRDNRLRKHLGSRYDAIPNVFDWDCSITLHDRQAEQIESREYSKWRRRGVAFELREADYIVSNRSLASGRPLRMANGEKRVFWGYWGDITSSPFLAFGIDTTRFPEFARQVTGKRVVAAATVSEVNCRSLLWQLQHGSLCPKAIAAPFLPTDEKSESKEETAEESVSEENTKQMDSIPELDEQSQSNDNENEATQSDQVDSLEERMRKNKYVPLNPFKPISVKLLPTNSFTDLPTRYFSLFDDESLGKVDLVYVGCSHSHLLDSIKLQSPETASQSTVTVDQGDVASESVDTTDIHGLARILETKALLIVESVLYMVELRPDDIKAYVNRVIGYASKLGFKPATNIAPMFDRHLFFTREPNMKTKTEEPLPASFGSDDTAEV